MSDNATEILDLLEGFLSGHVERQKPSLRQLLEAVLTNQAAQLGIQEKIMAGIDDLKAAVASTAAEITAASTSISTEIAAVEAAIAKLQAGGLSDADAEALAQTLQGSVTNLTTAQGTLDAETTKLGSV